MTHLIVSTIRRNIPHTESSGFVYVIDAEKQRVLQRSEMIEPAFREVDTNPRGGMRGMRGMFIRDNQIVMANASIIYRYDSNWDLLGIISHPSAAAIHDIILDGETLWATSARNDLVLQFDLAGNLLQHFYLREASLANRSLKWKPPVALQTQSTANGEVDFRDPLSHEEEKYDRAHVNSICQLADKSLLVSMGLVLGTKFFALLYLKSTLLKVGLYDHLLAVNRKIRSTLKMKNHMHSDLVVQPASGQSAIIRLSPDGNHRLVLALENITVPSHSLLPIADGTAVYLNTTAGVVVRFGPDDGRIISTTKVTDGFLRGVTALGPKSLVMGSKQEIIFFDPHSCQVKSTFRYTSDPNESIYDIKVLPDHFQLPPPSFEGHFQQITGVKSLDLPEQNYRLPRIKSPEEQLVSPPVR